MCRWRRVSSRRRLIRPGRVVKILKTLFFVFRYGLAVNGQLVQGIFHAMPGQSLRLVETGDMRETRGGINAAKRLKLAINGIEIGLRVFVLPSAEIKSL